MNDAGIARNEKASDDHQVMWDSIVVDPKKKSKLVNWAVLAMRLRSELDRVETAVSGVALLYGPPGTGKTTLARGVAGPLRQYVTGEIRVIEVDAHSLMSAEHGQSQRAAAQLLTETIPALTRDENPTIVVLDEVETFVVARSAASLTANPVDVHRTTDAALSAIDLLADTCPNVLFIATTNFAVTVDEAFCSRADISLEIPLPDAEAVEAILRATIGSYGRVFPAMKGLADDPAMANVAAALVGRDARQVRKFVADTLSVEIRTAADPESLTVKDLLRNAKETQ